MKRKELSTTKEGEMKKEEAFIYTKNK